MKKNIVWILLILSIKVFSQNVKSKITSISESYCKGKNQDLFCKSFFLFKEKQYDSCYVYSGKALLEERSKEKLNILNYYQGFSAIQKGLIKKALLNFKSLPDSKEFYITKKINLGYIYLKTEKFESAIEQYLPLLKKQRNLSKPQLKNIYHNLGICYLLHNKNLEDSKKYLDKELDLISKFDTLDIIGYKTELANLYYSQYLDDLAIPIFKEAYDLAKFTNSLDDKGRTTYNMAIVERNRKKYKESLNYFQEYIKIKDSISNRDKIWELTELDKKNAIKNKEKEIVFEKQKVQKQKEVILLLLLLIF